MAALHADIVGQGSPTLMLLHGLGVNGAVWQPLLPHLSDWPGRIVMPDLRGHGRSPHRKSYGLGHHAADVATLLAGDTDVHVLGHSMGGMVGLVLAGGLFGVRVASVFAFGVKVDWTEEELARGRQIASAPVRWFDDRAAAVERFLRVSGLTGLVGEDAPVVEAGVVAEGGRYRLAADSATVLAAGADIASVLDAAQVRWRLACGSRDPLVSIDALRRYDAEAIEIIGCGHNAHVEEPTALARLVPRP